MITTTYDPEADAPYVRFAPKGTEIAETREVQPDVMFDLTADGKLAGIEVLNVHALSASAPVVAVES